MTVLPFAASSQGETVHNVVLPHLSPELMQRAVAPAKTRARLAFCDEFDGLDLRRNGRGLWDTSYYWQPTPNGSSLPNEQEWYLNAEFAPTAHIRPWTVKAGVLTLTAARTDPSIAAYAAGHPYTSGVLTTGRSYSRRYGYFEMRAELPLGRGLWPAFWLEPADGTASHEIDVMEAVGQEPTVLNTTLHVFTGGHVMMTRRTQVADMTASFHLFGMDWQSDKITWYFDRRPVFQADTPAGLHKPMFMIVNLAAGGPMPGPVDATTPASAGMKIDYIRIYTSFPKTPPETATVARRTCPLHGT